jgi:hypothetical protein
MKGTKYTVLGEVTKEAKARLELISLKQAKILQQMVDEFQSGKYDDVIKDLPKNT